MPPRPIDIHDTSDTSSRTQTDRSEKARLETLGRYAILDTPPEEGFDDIVLLASRICATPVALVSLVAGDRQWFKARIGFDTCQTPLSQSVCSYALLQPGILVIPDLAAEGETLSPAAANYDSALLNQTPGDAVFFLSAFDLGQTGFLDAIGLFDDRLR